MAVFLPNGVTVALATGYGPHKVVSVVTNDDPGQITAANHGFLEGDFVEVFSGWGKLNQRIVRVVEPTTNTFYLEGIDTSSEVIYPPTTGIGSVRKITAWTQITQAITITMSGGEMQYVTYSFLEQDFETQIPTEASPRIIRLTIADDQTLGGYIALRDASLARMIRGLKLTFPSGTTILYNGYVSFNETPTLMKNELITVTSTFSLLAKPTRYSKEVQIIPPPPACDPYFDDVVLLLHFDL